MFEIGEYVVCGAKGVCQIRDITHIDMSGADKEKLYYVLAPVGDKNGTIYVPTDSEKIIMQMCIRDRSVPAGGICASWNIWKRKEKIPCRAGIACGWYSGGWCGFFL